MKEQNVQDLLKPRYLVIATWPDSITNVGDIYVHYADDIFKNGERETTFEILNKYPHLFLKIQWYEKRSQEELSILQYAKTFTGRSVRKVQEIDTDLDKITFVGGRVRSLSKWFPATEEEYKEYLLQDHAKQYLKKNPSDN